MVSRERLYRHEFGDECALAVYGASGNDLTVDYLRLEGRARPLVELPDGLGVVHLVRGEGMMRAGAEQLAVYYRVALPLDWDEFGLCSGLPDHVAHHLGALVDVLPLPRDTWLP